MVIRTVEIALSLIPNWSGLSSGEAVLLNFFIHLPLEEGAVLYPTPDVEFLQAGTKSRLIGTSFVLHLYLV